MNRYRSGFAAAALFSGTLFAQTAAFSGFTAGNLVVSRSVYIGDATTLVAGQALPPLCPSTASCATAKATDSGAYPSTSSTNNVWNNDKVDGSFGITSPIYLDQTTPSGTLVSTFAVPPGMIATSFSSKSELALNLSADGTAITFMGYIAPPNTIDVSNSNTPGVYDPTNPSGGSYFRAVAQIGSNGSIQITPTNAYSGNNGRAAILANGLYYLVGNSNNGGGTPANVVASAGAQIATPGQPATTAPQEIGNFSVTQYNDPTTNQPYPADKAGKDNNFRGLAIFNNTMYITKGSGGNGINTVYQVGAAGSLPTLANAASAPITILPGFPTTLAKNATMFPFGIWFANANTLYVADEGDGVAADAAGSKTAGLQKWSLVNGTWQLDYVLQNGLSLGQAYSVTNYPTSLNPATDGLRNLTGKVNGDGTVTIWAVTSTVSSNGDQGADPNKLVSIVDTLANTTAGGAASETFATVMSAPAGQVLRGVAFAPTGGTPVNVPEIQSAASPSVESIAAGGVAFAMGQNLSAGQPPEIFGPLPTSLGGTAVTIVDSAGKSWTASLLYASPEEVTFQIPSGVATGLAQVNISYGGTTQTAKNVQISAFAPALFTINGAGLPAAYAMSVSSNNTQTYEPVFAATGGDTFGAMPLNVTSGTVYLSLYGTGIAAAGSSAVTVAINGVNAPVTYAGPSGFTGVDQVNVLVPSSLAGKGNVELQLTVALPQAPTAVTANPVAITVQ